MDLKCFVEMCSEEERREMMQDFSELEKTGTNGDTMLRRKAGVVSDIMENVNVVLWMQQIMFEVFRYYTNAYIAEHKTI